MFSTTEKKFVYCAIRNDSFNQIQFNFSLKAVQSLEPLKLGRIKLISLFQKGPYNEYRIYTPEGKPPEREARHSPPSIDNGKNESGYMPTCKRRITPYLSTKEAC